VQDLHVKENTQMCQLCDISDMTETNVQRKCIFARTTDVSSMKNILSTETQDSEIPLSLTGIYINAMDNLEELQQKCPDIGGIIRYMQTGELPDEPKEARRIVYQAENCHFKDGLLYHHEIPKNRNLHPDQPIVKQLMVPECLRSTLLLATHTHRAHLGIDKTYAALRLKYFWHMMYRDTRQYIKSCEKCQLAKRMRNPPRPGLQPLPVPEIFDRWHIDCLQIKPKTPSGAKYLLICIDAGSKWLEVFPLANQSATLIAETFFREVISRYGCPKSIYSDRAFINGVFKALCKLFTIHHYHTSSYSPQSNGQAERANAMILSTLRCYLEDRKDQWEFFLPSVLAALRGTVSKSTGYSPYYLLFSKQMTYAIDCELLPTVVPKGKAAEEFVAKMVPRIEAARKIAQENLILAQQEMKRNYDARGTREHQFKPGDFVVMTNHNIPLGISPKIAEKYTGKYYVTGVTGLGNILLRDAKTNKEFNHPVNPRRLRHFYSDREIFEAYDARRAEATTGDESEDTAAEDTAAEDRSQTTAAADTADSSQTTVANVDATPAKTPPTPVGRTDGAGQDGTGLSDSNAGTPVNGTDTVDQTMTTTAIVPAAVVDTPVAPRITQYRDVKAAVGIKTIRGQKWYKLQFEDESLPEEWVVETKVPPIIKQEYHIRRTQKGLVRKNLRYRRGQ